MPTKDLKIENNILPFNFFHPSSIKVYFQLYFNGILGTIGLVQEKLKLLAQLLANKFFPDTSIYQYKFLKNFGQTIKCGQNQI